MQWKVREISQWQECDICLAVKYSKVGAGVAVAMKNELDVSCQPWELYTRLQVDKSKHV